MGFMTDGLHIHIWNRTMKPLAIAIGGAGGVMGAAEGELVRLN
jgi:hypothetical protein